MTSRQQGNVLTWYSSRANKQSTMRKFFSQKSKQKAHQHPTLSTVTGSSSPAVVSQATLHRDDETQISTGAKTKSQASAPLSPTLASTSMEASATSDLPSETTINGTSNESSSTEELLVDQPLPTPPPPEAREESKEKSKKLFVVVSGKRAEYYAVTLLS